MEGETEMGETETEMGRYRNGERQRQGDRDGETQRDGERQRDRETEMEGETEMGQDRDRDGETETRRHRDGEGLRRRERQQEEGGWRGGHGGRRPDQTGESRARGEGPALWCSSHPLLSPLTRRLSRGLPAPGRLRL